MFGMSIPAFMLKQMYKAGSLENQPDGFRFALTNPLAPATIVEVLHLQVAGVERTLTEVTCEVAGARRAGTDISEDAPLDFARGATVWVQVPGSPLTPGEHALSLKVRTEEFGSLTISVSDRLS